MSEMMQSLAGNIGNPLRADGPGTPLIYAALASGQENSPARNMLSGLQGYHQYQLKAGEQKQRSEAAKQQRELQQLQIALARAKGKRDQAAFDLEKKKADALRSWMSGGASAVGSNVGGSPISGPGAPSAGPTVGAPSAGPTVGSPSAGPTVGSPSAGPTVGSPSAGLAQSGRRHDGTERGWYEAYGGDLRMLLGAGLSNSDAVARVEAKYNDPKPAAGAAMTRRANDLRARRLAQQDRHHRESLAMEERRLNQTSAEGMGDRAFQQALGKDRAEFVAGVRQAGVAGQQMMLQTNQLTTLMDEGLETGALAPTLNAVAGVLRYLPGMQDFSFKGLDLETAQGFDSGASRLLTAFIGAQQGGIPASGFSDRDMAVVMRMVPGLEKTPGGNRIIIELLQHGAELAQERARMMEQWIGDAEQARVKWSAMELQGRWSDIAEDIMAEQMADLQIRVKELTEGAQSPPSQGPIAPGGAGPAEQRFIEKYL